MGFSRQECWSGLPYPSPGDLPSPGFEPRSPALQADSSPSEPPGKPQWSRSSSPPNERASFYLSVSQWMDMWLVFTLGLLSVMLLWVLVYKFLCGTYVFIYLESIPWNGIARPCGNSVWRFVFHSTCTILHHYHHCIRLSVSPCLYQYLLFVFFLL